MDRHHRISLVGFHGQAVHHFKNEKQAGILFNAVDYLELVDYTGRIVKKGKRGAIDQLTQPILKRLNLNSEEWLVRSCAFEENYHQLFAKRRSNRRKAA